MAEGLTFEMGDFFTVTEYPPPPPVEQAKKTPNKLSMKGQKQEPSSSDKDIPQEVINDFFKCKSTNHWFYEVLTNACSSQRDPADLCEMWERNENRPSFAIVDGKLQFLNPKEEVPMEEVHEMMERYQEHLWKSEWFRGLAVPQQQQVAERIQEKSTPSIFSPRKEESATGDGECESPPFLLTRQKQTGGRLIKGKAVEAPKSYLMPKPKSNYTIPKLNKVKDIMDEWEEPEDEYDHLAKTPPPLQERALRRSNRERKKPTHLNMTNYEFSDENEDNFEAMTSSNRSYAGAAGCWNDANTIEGPLITKIECPICHVQIPQNNIQLHANKCLGF